MTRAAAETIQPVVDRPGLEPVQDDAEPECEPPQAGAGRET